MELTANAYQTQALQTAIYPNQGNNLIYPLLGLVGEAGEVAEKVKKLIRDGDGILTDPDREKIALEVSDTCWYLAVLAYELDFTLEEVMQMNLDKLASRQERGVLSGSGDNR
jgi:NTP pyrophosphatase (non-canonical NTP hydrolase)